MRHNVGFRAADRLAARCGLRWGARRFRAELARGRIAGHEVCLLKPQTYMNLSGLSLAAAIGSLEVPPERVLVLHDEIDLTLGRIQIRRGGGDGGHRGVRSIAEQLGSSEFCRIRMGVGRPSGAREAADFVLDSFEPGELDAAAGLVERAAEAACCTVTEGLIAAMNRFNPWRPGERSGGGFTTP